MKRTKRNGELNINDVGKIVNIVGWVAKRRNLGSIIFLDLRDTSGIVQVTLKEGDLEIPDIRNEYVIEVEGIVAKKDIPNKLLKTGDIEVIASKITVFSKAKTTPLIIDDKTDALEDVRLKYRYLDLRRPCMQEKLRMRHKIMKASRAYLDEHLFTEIETPILTLSTPEGARDYLVPSRIHHGSFYALPQSPQLFKQLLMIGGMERYYQIARCFRDEDLRADRQPDFTQLDIEMSFMDEEQILTLLEGLLKKVFKDTINYDLKLPLRRIEYDYAVDNYGSDKPDTRFGMCLIDVKDILINSDFEPFKTSNAIRAIKVDGVAKNTTRKTIDSLQLEGKKFGLKGITVLKVINQTLDGSFVKYLPSDVQKALLDRLDAKDGDILLIASGERKEVCFGLGALRSKYAKELNLIKPNTYDLLWLVKWPLFSKIKETGAYTSEHHPFTRPRDEDLKYLKEDPSKVYSYAYDIVINGYEAGGGSLRIYDSDVQKQIFEILGLSEEDIKRKFGFFVEAFNYGTPPHGGIGFGLDRLTMILSGTDNIRDVIAFPKNLQATCTMSGAPNVVEKSQLDELGICLKDK